MRRKWEIYFLFNFFLILCDGQGYSSKCTEGTYDVKTDKEKLFELWSIFNVPLLAIGSLHCKVGNLTFSKIEKCLGFCVVLFQGGYKNRTQFACQQSSYKHRAKSHMCSPLRQNPYVIKYARDNASSPNSYEIYFKYCCNTSLCNEAISYDPFSFSELNKKVQLKETRDVVQIDEFLIYVIILLTTIACIWPFWYHFYWKAREIAGAIDNMHQPIEEALEVLQERPDVEALAVTDGRVSGQLSFLNICRTFAFMEITPPPVLNADAHLERFKFHEVDLEAVGLAHSCFRSSREFLIQHDTMIQALIEHGPYEYPWKPAGLVETFDQAKSCFEADSMLLHIPLPVVVIGDIQGQYADLHRWMQVIGNPRGHKLLFLGGVVDPLLSSSLECLAFVAALKTAFPNDVFMLRGIGETLLDLPHRFGGASDKTVLSAARRMCAVLPLAARLGSEILAVHSGICHDMTNLACLQTIKRPLHYENMDNRAKQIIFGQPTGTIKMYRYDARKGKYHFGLNAVQRICKETGVRLIIRSRNVLSNGTLFISGQKMLSIWSAPVEKGSIVFIDASLNVVLFTMNRQNEAEIVPGVAEKNSDNLNKLNDPALDSF
ncbi:unnamed protein product [Caenorhabditis auriculariae]|uniref:Serine/threonine specific protein phosphatases domain-containing protein n=1 Tax=Caenorhabditis auriculariae TaxID=2777116 RepID=A0A8S1GXD9_9PELO|nr:unnamed protein product [Caenorhabditis auriculariae]